MSLAELKNKWQRGLFWVIQLAKKYIHVEEKYKIIWLFDGVFGTFQTKHFDKDHLYNIILENKITL